MQPKKLGLFRQYLLATVASVSVIILGTSLGWPSPVLLLMDKSGYPMRLTNEEISWMVSLLYIGNLASPIPSGILMDKLGRKKSLLILATIPLAAWTIIYFAKTPIMLCVARFFAGTWSGAVSTIVPMYLAEISEPKIRGALSTFIQIMTNLGVMYEYVIGPYVSYHNLALISGAIPVIFVLTFYFMPESPYWMLMKNRKEEASKDLRWLRGGANIKEEIEGLAIAVQQEMKNKKSFGDLIRTEGNRKALLIVLVLAILQRMSGISALMAYTSTTLPAQGAGSLNPNECVMVIGTVWIISVFIATSLVDLAGRKPLLLVSSTGCALAMLVAGFWFYLNEKTLYNVDTYYWMPFAAFILYGLCFSIGLGPIPSTVQGEMFPTNIKGIASGVTSVALALTSFVMNKIYHTIADNVGMYLNYWIFSFASTIAIIFVALYCIETKGITLSEIQTKLNKSQKNNKNELIQT